MDTAVNTLLLQMDSLFCEVTCLETEQHILSYISAFTVAFGFMLVDHHFRQIIVVTCTTAVVNTI